MHANVLIVSMLVWKQCNQRHGLVATTMTVTTGAQWPVVRWCWDSRTGSPLQIHQIQSQWTVDFLCVIILGWLVRSEWCLKKTSKQCLTIFGMENSIQYLEKVPLSTLLLLLSNFKSFKHYYNWVFSKLSLPDKWMRVDKVIHWWF